MKTQKTVLWALRFIKYLLYLIIIIIIIIVFRIQLTINYIIWRIVVHHIRLAIDRVDVTFDALLNELLELIKKIAQNLLMLQSWCLVSCWWVGVSWWSDGWKHWRAANASLKMTWSSYAVWWKQFCSRNQMWFEFDLQLQFVVISMGSSTIYWSFSEMGVLYQERIIYSW